MIRRYLPFLIAVLLVGCSRAGLSDPTPPVPPIEVHPDVKEGEPTPRVPPTEVYPRTVNGITFQAEPVGLCSEPLQEATESQIETSPLNFSLSYLPDGYRLRLTAASTCQGEVVSLGKRYVGSAGLVNVARFTKRVLGIPSVTPVPIQVSGRPAVAVGTSIIVVEPFGLTEVLVDGLDQDQSLRIAAGIR